MKTLVKITLSLMLTVSFSTNAQQEPMLTQYMFNGLYLNPAYAGSHDYWSSTFAYRNQWTGANFEGAPQTAIAAVDGPISEKNMGLGAIVLHDEIGVTTQNSLMISYAYQLKLNQQAKLAFGLNAGFAHFSSDLESVSLYSDEPEINASDEVFEGRRKAFLPRFGLGAYYFSDKYYVGISVPSSLIAYQEGYNFSMDISKASFLERHYLLTGGIILPVSENVKLKPSILLKYVQDAPLQADLNFSAIFKDQFWIGSSFRTFDAVSIIAQYQTNVYFRIGYSYDITFSDLRGYQNGSHEIMLGIDFGKDLVKVKTPRYF
jgi:type IX secretion system PorP/SprF family membrane protein